MRVRDAAPRSRLGEMLVAEGELERHDLQRALKLQADFGHRLGTNLLELGLIGEATLLAALGRLRQTATATADDLADPPEEIIRLVPAKLARRYGIIPVRRSGGALLVASTDPGDVLVEDELGSLTSRLARTVIGLEVRIEAALARHYGASLAPRLAALEQRLADAPASPATKPSVEGVPFASTPSSPVESSPAESSPAESSPDLAAEPPTVRAKRAPPPRFIELGEDDRARIYETDDRVDTRTPEQRLEVVAESLTRAEIRDEIADLILAYCAPYLRRRLLLIRREGRILGWRGDGEGVTVIGLRGINIPGDEPSLFANLDPTGSLYLGPLSPFPAHRTLQDGIGTPPRACAVVPIKVRGRIACYLYGDNLAGDLEALPAQALERLARKAGTAFEVIILKSKIRRL